MVTILDTPPLPFEMQNDQWYSSIENLLGGLFVYDWRTLENANEQQRIQQLAQALGASTTIPIEGVSEQMLESFIGFLLDLQQGFFHYHTPKSALDILLLVTVVQAPTKKHLFEQLWQQKVRGTVTVATAQGSHEKMLKAQHVEHLAQQLLSWVKSNDG